MIVRKKIKYWSLYTILRLLVYILQTSKNVIFCNVSDCRGKEEKNANAFEKIIGYS